MALSEKETQTGSWMHRHHRLMLLCALLLPVVIAAVWFRLYFRVFYDSAQPAFSVPGLSENFVPQGVESCGDGSFLLSGYIVGTGSARIYDIGADGSARAIRICDERGTTLASHSGGICTNGPFTYLAGGNGKCYVLSSADLFDATSEEANILGVLKTDNAASYCCITDDALLIGEYEYGRRFTTPSTHHVTTPAGDRNSAVTLAYPLDGNQPFGVCAQPEAAYSTPERIQGMTFTDDGRVALSASSFKDCSQIFFYDIEAAWKGRQGIFWAADGQTPIPLYYLDSGCCTNIVPLPPYSEEVTYERGRLYVLFESASIRFQFGKLIGGQYVYRMMLPRWTKAD
jgi:hypothetical protein